YVPAGPPEDRLELLDDLPVAPDRAIEALQIAVHDEGQVVEPLACGDVQRAEGFGLVAFAVAEERPHPRAARVDEPAVMEVAVESRLVDRRERAEAHRDRGELPEVRHEPRVWVRREALAGDDLTPEVGELILGEPALEVRAGVDAGRCVPLEEDLVAGFAPVLAAEEVVEPHLVEARGRGVRGEVAADPGELVIGPQDHRRGVPPDESADPYLHR